MSCSPTHDDGRPVSAKLPAASETVVLRRQPVSALFPFMPSVVMVTPASGVSRGSDTTVRPIRLVVGATTDSETDALCDTDSPSTVADAEIERLAEPFGWLAGAVTIKVEF